MEIDARRRGVSGPPRSGTDWVNWTDGARCERVHLGKTCPTRQQTLVAPSGFDRLSACRETIDNWQRHGSGGAELATNIGKRYNGLIRIGAIVSQPAAQFRALCFGNGACRFGIGHTVEQVIGKTQTFVSIQFLKFGHERSGHARTIAEHRRLATPSPSSASSSGRTSCGPSDSRRACRRPRSRAPRRRGVPGTNGCRARLRGSRAPAHRPRPRP